MLVDKFDDVSGGSEKRSEIGGVGGEKQALMVEDEFADLSPFKLDNLGYSSVFGDGFELGFGDEVVGGDGVRCELDFGEKNGNVDGLSGDHDNESSPGIVGRGSNRNHSTGVRRNSAEGSLRHRNEGGSRRSDGGRMVDVSSASGLFRTESKGKRSRSCRSAQSSCWGPIERLTRVFGRSGLDERAEASDCETDLGNSGQDEVEEKLEDNGHEFGVGFIQQDGQVGEKDLQSSLTEEAAIDSGECPCVSSKISHEKRKGNGEVNDELWSSSEDLIVDELHVSENSDKRKKTSRRKQKKSDASHRNSRVSSKTTGRIPKCKNFPVEQSVNDVAEMAIGVLLGHDFSNSQSVAYETEGHKLPRTEGCSRGSAHRNVGNNLPKSETCTEVSGQNIGTSMDTIGCMSFPSGTVSHSSMMPSEQICESSAGNTVVPKDVPRSGIIGAGDERAPDESDQDLEQDLPPDAAWVLCDDCEKWRRISVELEKTLQETNCKWTCKDNIDKTFADCSIPQEKSNDEIDAELGILVGDDTASPICCSIGDEPSKLAAFQQDSWTPIESNVFLHRSRRYQSIDEIMVCHCNLPQDGRMGCGDQCLNRMLSIECVKETCPCGDLCSNQQFLKRKYAKFEWVRCGKKGFGLQLQENISQGQFLIEYVGEVLDFSEYDARQRSYASRGQKHFYFMTLNGGEVIDACAKGNLGRFINHSCDPNCRTEKWMVNGEVCVGLFAIRDIKKGEEVTFDYNYVRVVGAAAKKCVCGSSKCLGYIGGDPLNSEVIVEGDSDEEDIERSMICENGGRDLTVDDSVSDINVINTKVVQDDISVERKDIMVTCPLAIPKPDICGQVDNVHRPVPEADPFAIPVQPSSPMQSADTVFRPLPNISPLGDSNQVQLLETKQASTSTNEVLSDTILDSKKFISNIAEEKANTIKSYSSLKSSQSRTRVKKSKSSVKILVPHKPKTLASGTGSGCFEGVEEKLNELLDIDGGISKQKDATKGYLKLLFVTAAEGDGEACVSQSTRDLSLILDAILKTKSRKVLMDIINKNGLQMLHNIMKQNRRNFNRIPIIRKLLKVLEFLALTGILTTEQITTDAPGSGRESFKESILKLANHSDKQVHKIARSFRDKWIPRPIKRVELSERGDRRCRPRRANPSDVQSLLSIENQMPEVVSSKDAMQLEDEGPPGFGLHYKDQHSQVSSKNAVITDEMVMDNKGIPSPIKHIEPSERGDRKRRTRWDNPSDLQSLLSIEDRMPKVANSEDSMQLVEGPPGFALHFKDTHSWVSSENAEISVADVLTGKWVPRPIKPVEPSERDSKSRSWQDNPSDAQSLLSKEDQMPEFASSKGLMELDDDGPPGFGLHYKDHHSQVSSENAVITNEVVTGYKFIPPIKCIEPFERGERKHKTRWDNPSDPLPVLSRDNQVHISSSKDSMQGPPGFGVYYKDQNSGVSSRNALVTGEVVMGQVQDIFRPQLGISYGFPVYQMQQFGTRETVGGSCNSSWAIAPGIPFHPFPPLPNYPRRPPDSREQGQHIHRRFQPFRPHNRFGRDFKVRGRNGHRGSFGGNGRRGWRGSFCPPNGVNNNSNSNAGSGFH